MTYLRCLGVCLLVVGLGLGACDASHLPAARTAADGARSACELYLAAVTPQERPSLDACVSRMLGQESAAAQVCPVVEAPPVVEPSAVEPEPIAPVAPAAGAPAPVPLPLAPTP